MVEIKKIILDKTGSTYIKTVVLFLVSISVIALFIQVMPVAFMKIELYKFGKELKRTVEINGTVGIEAKQREEELVEKYGINPEIEYSEVGDIDIGENFTITLKTKMDIGIWGIKDSVPLVEEVVGTSEVYHK